MIPGSPRITSVNGASPPRSQRCKAARSAKGVLNGEELDQLQKDDESHEAKMRYPLVNVYRKLWKNPPFSMGRSTISTGSFSIANC